MAVARVSGWGEAGQWTGWGWGRGRGGVVEGEGWWREWGWGRGGGGLWEPHPTDLVVG